MSRKSSRPNGARTTKYPFIRITEGQPTKADLKWASQVLPAEGLDGLVDFLLADAPEDGISEEVIAAAKRERLGQSTLMAVVSNIYMHQHNQAVRPEHKRLYRERFGYSESEVAVNLLLVGPLDRCRRVIEVSDEIISRNPLLPTVQDTSFADAGLTTPPVVVRNFLTEIDTPPVDGESRLHLSVETPDGPKLFEVTPPEEIVFLSSADDPEPHGVDARLYEDGSVSYSNTADGDRLKLVTDAIPFREMAERYARANGFPPEQLLVMISVLQLVSVEAPDRFRVVMVGDRYRGQLLVGLAIAVWGWGMFGLRGRGTQS